MSRISQETVEKNYYKIYEQVYESPTASIQNMAEKTGLTKRTVSKALRDMYDYNILIGPYIEMKPAVNYKEYVYLMNFEDPFKVFTGLKGFPHVLDYVMTFGDWNTLIITDRLLDLSQLVGFQSMLYQGVRGYSYTPKVESRAWDISFERMLTKVAEFTPVPEHKNEELAPFLDWEKDQWELFHAFHYNIRKTVTPTLKRIRVRYESYMKWMDTLNDHCSVHVEFYPQGYHTYLTYCFLISSEYKSSVKSLFALFPATSFITEVGDQLLIFTRMLSSNITTKLYSAIYQMQTKEIIKGFNHAVAVLGRNWV